MLLMGLGVLLVAGHVGAMAVALMRIRRARKAGLTGPWPDTRSAEAADAPFRESEPEPEPRGVSGGDYPAPRHDVALKDAMVDDR